MPDQFETPEPDEAVKLALRRIEEATARGEGSDVDGLAFNEVVVNMGPQHPSTHGVLRLVVTLDGELVKDVIPVIGYLHRCKEKLAEKRTYFQYIPIVDRTEYVASINCEWGYVMTVEKLAGMQVTRRAEFIRVITGELMRIASHLVAVGTFTADLSPLGTAMVFYMFRDREVILDLMEELTGARMMFNYFRFGGVRYDLPDGWVEKCRDFLKMFPAKIKEYEALVDTNAVFLQRTQGKGVITQQDVVDYGITGPNARASGVDLRPAPLAAVLGVPGARLRGRHRAARRHLRPLPRAHGRDAREPQDHRAVPGHAAQGPGPARLAARSLRHHAAARLVPTSARRTRAASTAPTSRATGRGTRTGSSSATPASATCSCSRSSSAATRSPTRWPSRAASTSCSEASTARWTSSSPSSGPSSSSSSPTRWCSSRRWSTSSTSAASWRSSATASAPTAPGRRACCRASPTPSR